MKCPLDCGKGCTLEECGSRPLDQCCEGVLDARQYAVGDCPRCVVATRRTGEPWRMRKAGEGVA